MMGLPTETYEDLDGISDICKKVAYCWRENTPDRARGVRITASASCFVPKPQTPFPVGRAGHARAVPREAGAPQGGHENQECHLQLA